VWAPEVAAVSRQWRQGNAVVAHSLWREIGYVSTSLSGGSKPGWAVHPPHGAGKGESDKQSAIGGWWESDAKGEDVADAQMKAVEAIGNILFAHADRAMARVSVYNFLEETDKCASKLH
jgi:hypothetical protein